MRALHTRFFPTSYDAPIKRLTELRQNIKCVAAYKVNLKPCLID